MQRSLGGCRGCLGGKTAVSGSVGKQRAVAAPHLHRKLVRIDRALRPSTYTRKKPVTCASGHNQPEAFSTACSRDENVQKVLEKTLQVCKVLAAAMAASMALQAAPALSSEGPQVVRHCTSTLHNAPCEV